MSSPPFPRQNHLLANLSDEDFAALAPFLEPVEVEVGFGLYEFGECLRYVYFPTTAIASLMYITEDGHSTEIAVVGNEGVVGISLFMGGETTLSHAVIKSSGIAYRIRSRVLKEVFYRVAPIQRLFLLYLQALLTQMAQTAVCNRLHTVDQQVCRSLLMSLDRLPSSEVVMTQELIASMLGVRREGVTEVAGRLQKDGLITYHRGHITVLDRPGLEDRTCECYAVVKREYERLLPDQRNAKSPARKGRISKASGQSHWPIGH